MSSKVFINKKESYNCPDGANKALYWDDYILQSDNLILCNNCKLKVNCNHFKSNSIKSISIKEVDNRFKSMIGKLFDKDSLEQTLIDNFNGYLTSGWQSTVGYDIRTNTKNQVEIYVFIQEREDKEYDLYTEYNNGIFLITSVKRRAY